MGDSNSSPTGEPLASTKSSEKLSAKDIKDEVKQRIAREKLATPEPLRNVLKEHSGVNDCLPCRVMGSSAFIGLAAYSYFSGHKQIEQQRAKIIASKSMFGIKSRQAGITTIAFTLGGMGLWRLIN